MLRVVLVVALAFGASALNVKEVPAKKRLEPKRSVGVDIEDWETPKSRGDEPLGGLSGNQQTWEELAHKRNEAVRVLQNQSIMFYGDSIVEHWTGETQGRQNDPLLKNRAKLWQKHFVERYGASHASGIGGDMIPNLLWRLENGASPIAHPRLIMLHIGTNDLKHGWLESTKYQSLAPAEAAKKIFAGYHKIVEHFDKASPHSVIVLTALFPRGSTWPQGSYGQIIPEFNKLIASLADGKTIHFSDCGHVMLKKNGKIDASMTQNSDFLHPSDESSVKWAECLYPTLDKILLDGKQYS